MNIIKKVFEKMGEFLVDLLKLDRPGKGKLELQQELAALSTGRKSAVRSYYIKKTASFLAVLTVGLIFSGVCFIVYAMGEKTIQMQLLERPGYGEGDRKEELTVQIIGAEDEEQMEVTVQERKYTDQEKQELLDAALDELDRVLPGENESLDKVRTALNFPVSMMEGAVAVSWMTMPYGVINEDGSVKTAEDSGTLVEIQATLTCGGREAIYTACANVFPPELSEREQLRQSIQKEVAQADARESITDVLTLPDDVDGKELIWKKEKQNPVPALLALTLIVSICVYLQMDSTVHSQAEARKNQLILDYPDLMWKMTMLLGAGLSIRGTFVRISEEYLRKQNAVPERKKRSTMTRYVYEEVCYACYEMQSGVSEAQAYERFGKRCQLPEYIRLGSVLSQNLKKGAKGLTELLEAEAESSLNDRKNRARKIGEQAGTKLLLPMVLMLGIVLVILMVPAFLSF